MFWAAEISAATQSVGSVPHEFRSTHSTARRASSSPTANNRSAIDVDSSRVASPITSRRSTSHSTSNIHWILVGPTTKSTGAKRQAGDNSPLASAAAQPPANSPGWLLCLVASFVSFFGCGDVLSGFGVLSKDLGFGLQLFGRVGFLATGIAFLGAFFSEKLGV